MSDNGPETDSQTEATQDKKKQKKKRTIIIVTSISLVVLIAVGVWVVVGVVGCGTSLVGTYKEERAYSGKVIILRSNKTYETGSTLSGEFQTIDRGKYRLHITEVTLISQDSRNSDVVYDHVGRYLVDQYMHRFRKLSDEEAQRLLKGQNP